QEYLGLVWVYMGEGQTPPMWRFPHLERKEDGIVEVTGGTIVPTCYVNSLENDPAHVPFVHREAGHAQEIPHVISEETEYGIRDVMPNISILNRTTHRIMPHARLFRTFTAFPREIGWAEQLSRSDTGVVLMRSIFQRELRALAEGRPLKQWTIPDHFEIPLD